MALTRWILVSLAAASAMACSDARSDGKAGSETEADGGAGPGSTEDSGTVSLVPTNPATLRGTGPREPSPPKLTGCGIETTWDGDEYCILPPPEGEGFQIHTGPADYDDPDDVAKFTLEAGGETNEFLSAVSGNTEDIFFYGRQYRMRPGSHHLIVSEAGGASGGSILGFGRRLGGTQNAVKDNPANGMPEENAGIGMPLGANKPLSLSLHYFNSTDHALLKEVWVNFWYVDAAEVTQEAREIFIWAQGAAVQPGETATTRAKYPISQEGRVLTMYGHRHSNNVRFSAYRNRGGERELVYDDYDWEEPTVFEFNTVTTNPAPAPGGGQPGGHTGILDLLPGDTLEWECEVKNLRSVPVTFGENEAATSEMCILVGDAIGPGLGGIGTPF